MTDEWQQTDQIVMSVQTAEIRQSGINEAPTLNLSCGLVNIARGQCFLKIEAKKQSADFDDGVDSIGSLTIEIDRPVIQGTATIPKSLYDSLVTRLASAPPRPVSISLSIAQNLAVSLEGDLRIDDVTEVVINDLSVTIPLK